MQRRLRQYTKVAIGLLVAAYLAGCSSREPSRRSVPPPRSTSTREVAHPDTFVATAYSLHGTPSGSCPYPGIVAADPRILPLGSQIRVSDAGPYSGTYTVANTGHAVSGRRIDVYIPNHAEARQFGRRTVRVQVLQYGSSPKGGSHGKLRQSARTDQ